MSDQHWPFDDPPNAAVFVDKNITEKKTWIYCVCHDEDDGAWQFHGPDGYAKEEDAKIVALKSIVVLEPSLLSLADLPRGWCAWRETPTSEWQRAPVE